MIRLIKHLAGQPVTVQQIAYTANGQQAFVRGANGNQTVYSYDGHDRPIRITYPDSSLDQHLGRIDCGNGKSVHFSDLFR